MSETNNPSRDKLVSDLKVVVADAEELLKLTAGQAGEKLTDVRSRLGDRLAVAKERIADAEAALIDLTLAEHPDLEQADAKATLHDLKHITDQLLVRNPSYRCNRCGFGARSHHWQCPSCKEWGTVKPLLNYAVV